MQASKSMQAANASMQAKASHASFAIASKFLQANASQCKPMHIAMASKLQNAYLQLRQSSKLMQAAIANKLQMQASKANASKCLANAHCNSQQATKAS